MTSSDRQPSSRRRFTLFSEEGVAVLCLVLFLAEGLLFILSWLLSATMTEGVRSLLSSEGIRWFFGCFTAMMASPLLVWLILLLSALGSLQKCGALSLFIPRWSAPNFRDRLALRLSLVFLAIYIVIICLLTLMPHAILLSATGQLFPSAFSRSLIPIIAFGISLFSVVFGMMSGRVSSLSAILRLLTFGISRGASLIILCILLIQFLESLFFVFW